MTPGELLLIVAGFFSGALPFSHWVGKVALNEDIRAYGDGNPGAFNVLRAGGYAWGAIAMILDMTKAAIPVGLATYVFSITGLPLVIIALAPPLGHAFSPFLGFKGGKAIAATGGTWIGLTLWRVPLVGMLMLVFWYRTVTSSGWAVIFTMIGLFAFLLPSGNIILLAVWAGIMLLMIYKHRTELVRPPQIKPGHPLRTLIKSLEQNRDSGDHAHHGGPDRH